MPFLRSISLKVKSESEGVYAGVTGEEGGRAKFTEYRDLRQGVSVFGNVGLGLDSEHYFLKLRASDMGYDTQSYRLEGGMWGKFKVYLFYDEIPHNLTFDSRTFFLGGRPPYPDWHSKYKF